MKQVATDGMIEGNVANSAAYELIGRIAGDRIVAFNGRRGDGASVLMHQLSPGYDHSAVLKLAIGYMLRCPPAQGGRILDLVELDGVPYLVTADETTCLALQDWLEWESGREAAQDSQTIQGPAVEPGTGPGDFTRRFQRDRAGDPLSDIGTGFGTSQADPFFGSPQSVSGTHLSSPQGTWSQTRSGPLLTPAEPKRAGEFTGVFGLQTLGGRPQDPAAKLPANPADPPLNVSPEPQPGVLGLGADLRLSPGSGAAPLRPTDSRMSEPAVPPLHAAAAQPPSEYTKVTQNPARLTQSPVPSPQAPAPQAGLSTDPLRASGIALPTQGAPPLQTPAAPQVPAVPAASFNVPPRVGPAKTTYVMLIGLGFLVVIALLLIAVVIVRQMQ